MIILVFAPALMLVIMAVLIPWNVHRKQTVDFTSRQCYGNTADFWREFKCHQWQDPQPEWSSSYFDRSTKSEIHASIIEFDGVGMLLGPVDYFLVTWKLRRLRRSRIGKSWPQRKAVQK